MSERVILHSDMNCFYASVEMLHHPEFTGMPLAVGGDPEARHGIVLTANYIAKQKGVKTGMALWQAKQICPEIIFVPPRMDLYLRFSQMAREIYSEYTDKIEPYGIDEAWLDVSDSRNLKGSGMTIAREISHRIKYELGVTVSIGISWNKIYAKLGSDYKKPDAITEFNRENYKDRIWQLPATDLLYVGRQTNKKLQKLGIRTIGQLAESDEKLLESHLGKIGNVLWAFANGWDEDPVCKEGLLSDAEYSHHKEIVMEDIRAIERNLSELEAPKNQTEEQITGEMKWKQMIRRFHDATEISEEMADAFIETMKIHEDGTLEIKLSYMDEFAALTKTCEKIRKEVA